MLCLEPLILMCCLAICSSSYNLTFHVLLFQNLFVLMKHVRFWVFVNSQLVFVFRNSSTFVYVLFQHLKCVFFWASIELVLTTGVLEQHCGSNQPHTTQPGSCFTCNPTWTHLIANHCIEFDEQSELARTAYWAVHVMNIRQLFSSIFEDLILQAVCFLYVQSSNKYPMHQIDIHYTDFSLSGDCFGTDIIHNCTKLSNFGVRGLVFGPIFAKFQCAFFCIWKNEGKWQYGPTKTQTCIFLSSDFFNTQNRTGICGYQQPSGRIGIQRWLLHLLEPPKEPMRLCWTDLNEVRNQVKCRSTDSNHQKAMYAQQS